MPNMEACKLIFLMIVALLSVSCTERKTPVPNETVPVASQPSQSQPSKPAENNSNFDEVKSMLSRNCTPCHEPGGKMYEKLPFDNPEAVRANSSPILRRIDKPEDKWIMEEWLSDPIH
jgi:hypothetical protein